jgi:phosphomannomutase
MKKLLSIFDETTQKNILVFLNGNYDPKIKEEIINLIKNNPEEARNAFYTKISFGTGGIRGKMGIGSNRLNEFTIRAATQGLANYLKKQSEKDLKVLIGYDSRKNSKFFAEETAGVLAENGIKALIFKTICPTPLVSYGCRFKKCIAAVMITASHNPPEYNGYKVYWKEGAQVLPPHDTNIIKEVDAIKDPSKVKVAFLTHPLIEWVGEEIIDSYLKKIEEFKSEIKNKKEGDRLQLIYTPLHGTGIVVLPQALASWGFNNLSLVQKQSSPDENFTYAKKPNPEERSALEAGISLLLEKKGDLLIATDPDADRLGVVINHKGSPVILTGNQIGCILLEYILASLKKEGKLEKNGATVKSIVTTDLFSEISKSYGISCFDVLTGFKYIGEKIRLWEESGKFKFLFGAEESFGFLRGDFARDKDAISAACILAEAALSNKMNHKTLVDMLHEIYKKYGLYRESLISLELEEGSGGMERMKKIMEGLRNPPPETIDNYQVAITDDYKTKKRSFLNSKSQEGIDLPSSDVLIFTLSDKSKIIIRPSGTEPKVKIYLSTQERNFKSIEQGIKICDERLSALASAIKKEISTKIQ